jgi:hypothetical protein
VLSGDKRYLLEEPSTGDACRLWAYPLCGIPEVEMNLGVGKSNAALGMRMKLDSIRKTLDKWGAKEIPFSPPRPAAMLRPSPLTSTFTSNDIDYDAYLIGYLLRRVATIEPRTWKVRRMATQVRGLQTSLDRVAERHGETIRWDAA